MNAKLTCFWNTNCYFKAVSPIPIKQPIHGNTNARPQRAAARGRTVFADGLDEYTGEWTTAEVAHLLKRTLFGVKVNDLKYFLGRSMSESVDELLTPSAAPATVPLNSYSSKDIQIPQVWPHGIPGSIPAWIIPMQR